MGGGKQGKVVPKSAGENKVKIINTNCDISVFVHFRLLDLSNHRMPLRACVCRWVHTYLWSDAYQMTVVSRLPKQRRVIPKEQSDFENCPLIPLPSC